MKVSALNQACLTKHESMTWTMPSIVTDVSAMFVATTTFLEKKDNKFFHRFFNNLLEKKAFYLVNISLSLMTNASYARCT